VFDGVLTVSGLGGMSAFTAWVYHTHILSCSSRPQSFGSTSHMWSVLSATLGYGLGYLRSTRFDGLALFMDG
jgi:hypothetical protein